MAVCSRWNKVLNTTKGAVFGMIHVQALPGTPKAHYSMEEIVSKACQEAQIYKKCGLQGVIVENMHDVPYLNGGLGPEIVACMTRVATEVRRITMGMVLGIQILSGANKDALAVAKASGAEFIRAESFVFSHVADEGWMDSCAGDLLRYRKMIDAESVMVLTDIKKKHCSHSVTSDLDITEVARAAQFFCSDGLIVTGKETGLAADLSEIDRVHKSVDLPVIVGSGVTQANLNEYLGRVDAMIVGSHFKKDGKWYNDVDEAKVQAFMDTRRTLMQN